MICCPMQCYALLSNATRGYAVLCQPCYENKMQKHAMLRYTKQCNALICNPNRCYARIRYTMPIKCTAMPTNA